MDKIFRLIKKIIPKRLFRALQPAYHFLLAALAAVVYRFPSEKLIVVGVTGTTGKTTSTYLIAQALEANGLKAGYTSTAIFNNGRQEWLNDKKMTMIGRFFTQKILSDMVRNGCQVALVETTSEGIAQFRHRFINYDILVFTGLYPEHIDSHGSFENYKNAKGELFSHLRRCRTKYLDDKRRVVMTGDSGLKKIDLNRQRKSTVINGDDKHAEFFLNFPADEKILYARDLKRFTGNYHHVRCVSYGTVRISEQGTEFRVQDKPVRMKLLGEFNATNAMNAIGVGLALGLGINSIVDGLESIGGVPGRLERIDEGQDFTVIVDYAFEPGAVAKLYETIRSIPHDQVIHVLGSTGGGRDIARRPILGKLAGENADVVIVTNEDPYDDDPDIIIDQVALGAEKAGKTPGENLFRISERREAIKKALALAKSNDIVLITGKGSEQAICLANGEKIPWDDRAAVRSLLIKEKK